MDYILTDNIVKLFSESRLNSYKFDFIDDNYIVLQRYLYNIELSKSLYPLLSLLEITLRNRINLAIEKTIKPNWLIQELEEQDILFN